MSCSTPINRHASSSRQQQPRKPCLCAQHFVHWIVSEWWGVGGCSPGRTRCWACSPLLLSAAERKSPSERTLRQRRRGDWLTTTIAGLLRVTSGFFNKTLRRTTLRVIQYRITIFIFLRGSPLSSSSSTGYENKSFFARARVYLFLRNSSLIDTYCLKNARAACE